MQRIEIKRIHDVNYNLKIALAYNDDGKNEREKQEDRRIKIKSLLIEQECIFTFSQKLLYNVFLIVIKFNYVYMN